MVPGINPSVAESQMFREGIPREGWKQLKVLMELSEARGCCLAEEVRDVSATGQNP